MPYARALAVQREVNLAVSQETYVADVPGADASGDTSGGCLLLVEHDPVITITHRQGAWDNLLAPQDRLDALGIDVQVTDRGGDITYHGPGQLVAYPILRLNPLGLNLSSYMRLLEHVVIDALAHFGVQGVRDDDATGVWVASREQGSGHRDQADQNPGPRSLIPEPLSKICAMGVRVRKNTTMHGLALNVTTDLDHFKTIDPCGLGGRPVTSLAQLLGEDVPDMQSVKKALIETLASAINAQTSGDTQ